MNHQNSDINENAIGGGSPLPFRHFSYRKVIYIWNEKARNFYRLTGLETQVAICAEFQNFGSGLTTAEAADRSIIYGRNEMYIALKPLWQLLFFEILNPFYVFQIFSIGLWFYEQYNYYAVALLLISTISIASEVYQIRKNQLDLRKAVQSAGVCRIFRDGVEREISSTEVVPGDVLHVPPHGCELYFDAVLLNGNCVVNESLLTGMFIKYRMFFFYSLHFFLYLFVHQ